MNTIGSSRFNFSLPEAEAKDDMKIAGNQLVGSGQTNDVKTPTPPSPSPSKSTRKPKSKRRIKGPVSTSTKQLTGYLTVNGIQSETSYQESDWPLFALKELMDNAFDFLNDYYANEAKESRNISVCIKIDLTKDILRIAVRNSNVNDVPVFENIGQIFNYNMWFSTKRNQHRISCGSLGDFLKRVLGMGYASWTSRDSSGDSFEEKQWEEPIVLRFNGKEVKVFLKVDSDTWATWADIQPPTVFNAPNFTEVEIALPVIDHWLALSNVLSRETGAIL